MASGRRLSTLVRLACGCVIAIAAACGADGRVPWAIGQPARSNRPIFYGQTTPTLYPGLTEAQQNAVVQLFERAAGAGFCSGTLISPRVVLTAGHCIHYPPYPEYTAGDISVRIGPDSSAPLSELTVERVAHKDWEIYAEDDVGIVVLASEHTAVPPFTIKRGGIATIGGQQAQAVGFGMTQDDDPYFPTNTRRHWTTLDVLTIDAINVIANGHGDTGIAPGDSGGPLLYDFGSGPQVAGIASMAEPSNVDNSYYTNVETQEAYIQQFVDWYDPACRITCADVECGMVGGCQCSECARGFECRDHRCHEKPAGSGGVCVTRQSTYALCSSTRSCGDGYICYLEAGFSGECGEPCGPTPCVPDDLLSFCLPQPMEPDGMLFLCHRSVPSYCSEEYTACYTEDGSMGICLRIGQDSEAHCYTSCATVDTCPGGTGCIPYTPPDCAALCAGLQCGPVDVCDCGQCTGSQRCLGYQCVDDSNSDDDRYADPYASSCGCRSSGAERAGLAPLALLLAMLAITRATGGRAACTPRRGAGRALPPAGPA